MVQNIAVKPEFGAGLRHATQRLDDSSFLSQPRSKWVPFFELDKAKAAKPEGWAPPLIYCAHDTVEL